MMELNGRRGQIFFYGLFALLAVATFFLIRPFISVILIALITVVLLRPAYIRILDHKWVKGRVRIATSVTLLSFLLLIIIPLLIVGSLVISELSNFFEYLATEDIDASLSNLLTAVEDFIRQIPPFSDIEIGEEEFIQFIQDIASSILVGLKNLAINLGKSLPALFIGGIIFLVLLASLLPAFDDLNKWVEDISPLDVSISQLYLHKAQLMIVSVIKGVFLLAILQGLIMGFFYWLAGIPFAWFWMLLSMAFAIMPVVGISFIVIPMAILAVVTGNITAAVLVLIGFYVFVNPLDIILRPRLVSKEAYLNFTLMLLALFGGIQLAGILGMIYGPVIMILLLTTIDIYTKYYANNDGRSGEKLTEEAAENPEAPEDAPKVEETGAAQASA